MSKLSGYDGCKSLPLNASELLVVIKETENDDLTGVLEELIDTYPHQIGDVAVGLCQHLVLILHTLYHISVMVVMAKFIQL